METPHTLTTDNEGFMAIPVPPVNPFATLLDRLNELYERLSTIEEVLERLIKGE